MVYSEVATCLLECGVTGTTLARSIYGWHPEEIIQHIERDRVELLTGTQRLAVGPHHINVGPCDHIHVGPCDIGVVSGVTHLVRFPG